MWTQKLFVLFAGRGFCKSEEVAAAAARLYAVQLYMICKQMISICSDSIFKLQTRIFGQNCFFIHQNYNNCF